jgi:hypothetical protein
MRRQNYTLLGMQVELSAIFATVLKDLEKIYSASPSRREG